MDLNEEDRSRVHMKKRINKEKWNQERTGNSVRDWSKNPRGKTY